MFFSRRTSYSSSLADPGVIWVAMGTEGVLVGPNPLVENPAARDWTLTRNGINAIHYLPLSITRLDVVAGIVALGLFVPPLPLIHWLILSHVYMYAFQPRERYKARLLAAAITGIITILAAAAIVFWLTNTIVDYYPIVAVMSGICVLLGVGGGVWISRKRNFSDLFIGRMARASGWLSLIVPAGVASIWFLWPFIIFGTISFGIYRVAFARYLDQQGVVATREALDRFTFATVRKLFLLLLPFGSAFAFSVFSASLPSFAFGSIFLLLNPAAILIIWWLIYKDLPRRSQEFLFKKKSALPDESETPKLFTGRRWRRTLFWVTAAWMVASIGGAIGFYALQTMAAGWFQTLLVNTR